MTFDILPEIGIGPVTFSMKPAEVLALLGEPQRHEPWMGGNLNNCLMFHGVLFHFLHCDSHGPLPDSKIEMIQIYGREEATLFGKPLTNWHREGILHELQQRGFNASVDSNGSIGVMWVLELGFADDGRADFIEIYSGSSIK